MKKKSEQYRTECIVEKFNIGIGHECRETSPECTPQKKLKSCKEFTYASTQTSLQKKDAHINTVTPLISKREACCQMDEISLEELHSTEFHKSSLNKPFLQKFEEQIDKYGQTEKMHKLVEAVATERLSPNNLSWKCALDMGALSMCTSTTHMHYDIDCIEFFALFNLMFGSSLINVLRGAGHFSSIVKHTTEKGKYDPLIGIFNFPIPSVNTLCTIATGYPSYISMGFINQSLDMAQEEARKGVQYVLGFDGKMVVQGCKGESDGDVNLWGREKPSITSAVNIFTLHSKCSEDVDFPSTENNIVKHCTLLRHLALHVSCTLKQLYSCMSHAFYQHAKLVHLAKENPDNVTRYNTRMSFLHQNTSECERVYWNGLDTQDEILKALALLYGWEDMDGHIILSTMPNCFQLLPPEELSGIIDITDETNYEYIKQRSEMWYSVRQKFRVTVSTLYRAIGLDML